MSFIVIKKWGIFPELIHAHSFYNYGFFLGNINLERLNAIYTELTTNIVPFELDEWREIYLQEHNPSSKISNRIIDKVVTANNISLKDTTDLKAYHLFCLNSGFGALMKYIMESVMSGKYDLWFKEFIPIVQIKQLNNNPWSELDPFDDPKVNWKFSWGGFNERAILNFLVALNLDYKLIDEY